MRHEKCECCKAKDWATLSEHGVYVCHECRTLFWFVPAGIADALAQEAGEVAEVFIQAHPDYNEI